MNFYKIKYKTLDCTYYVYGSIQTYGISGSYTFIHDDKYVPICTGGFWSLNNVQYFECISNSRKINKLKKLFGVNS